MNHLPSPQQAHRQAHQPAHRTPSPPSVYDLRRWLVPLCVFALLALGCSAADLVQRQRVTPTPTEAAALAATFTPTPVSEQNRLIVTPPATDKPGVIIVPPGTDPESVLPVLPTATPTPMPTDTPTPPDVSPGTSTIAPTPTGQVPPSAGTPGAGPGSPLATPGAATPILVATATQPGPTQPPPTPTPTFTPTPTIPPSPTPTATPYVLVPSGLVALRTGPGLDYPLLAQLGPDIPVAVIGRSEDGNWLEICCVSGESVWVVTSHVVVNNDITNVPVSFSAPPPPPTPTFTPTPSPTVTLTPTPTRYPFERAIGPQFFPTNNEYLTIWGKLYVGVSPNEDAVEGYALAVEFEGFDRPNALGMVFSEDDFQYSAPPGSGNRVLYNYKYEFRPPDPSTLNTGVTRLQLLGTGTWSVYVTDGTGAQLSEPVTFTTAPSNPNREVYIGWIRVR